MRQNQIDILRNLHNSQKSVELANSISEDLGVPNLKYSGSDLVQPLTTINKGGFISDFLNSMAEMGMGNTQLKLDKLDTEEKVVENQIFDINDRIEQAKASGNHFTAATLESQKQQKILELRSLKIANEPLKSELKINLEEGTGLVGGIAGGAKDVKRRAGSVEREWIKRQFQKDPFTNPIDYLRYEAGTDLGSSAGTLGTQAASLGAHFGIRLFNASMRGGAASSSNLWGAGITLGVAALDTWLTYEAREEETGSEVSDAFQAAMAEFKAQYMKDNNITDEEQLNEPQHRRALNSFQIKAFNNLEGLRKKNMALGFSDALQRVIAITPFTNFANKLYGTNRWARTSGKLAGAGLTMHSEALEEGLQWMFTQQYLNKTLNKPNVDITDETDYSKAGISTVLKNVLTDAYDVEKAIFFAGKKSIYQNEEFRSSVNAGAIASGPLSLIPNLTSAVADHIGYNKAKNFLGKAAQSELAGEYLRFKYETYFDFLNRYGEKPDYFIDNIRKLSRIEGSGITPEQAEKEIRRFKKAKQLYDEVNKPRYFAGVIEVIDNRDISRRDRTQAAINSLMVSELEDMKMDILTLKAKEGMLNPVISNDIELLGENRAFQEELAKESAKDPSDPTRKTPADLLSQRKKLFKALLDPEKVKDLSIGKDELYDNFDIPIILIDRKIEKLKKEIEDITSTKTTKERRENERIAKSGTEAQKNKLAYKKGNNFVKNNNMVGSDGLIIGEEEYVEYLEEVEDTSLLRDQDKRETYRNMRELELDPLDRFNYAVTTNAPLEQSDLDDLKDDLKKKAFSLFSDASQIEDSNGETENITDLSELENVLNNVDGIDVDYYNALKQLYDKALRYTNAANEVDNLQTREPEGKKTSKLSKRIQFVFDRFLNEIRLELEKATDDDYLDTTGLEHLQKKLKWLKDVLIEDMALKTSTRQEVKDLNAYIEQLESDLAKSILDVRARLADKDLQQEKAYTQATEEAALSYGLTYKPADTLDDLQLWNSATPVELQKIIKTFIDSVAIQDKNGKWFLHHSYVKAIGQFILAQDKDHLNRMELDYKNLVSEISDYVIGRYEKIANNVSRESLEDTFMNDPELGMRRIPGLLMIHELLNDLANPLTEYLNTKDINLIRTVGDWIYVDDPERTLDEQKAIMQSLVDKFVVVRALHKGILEAKTKHNIKAQLQSEINIFSNLSEFLPTKQQIVVLRELLAWFYKEDPQRKDFNVATVLGFAGTGKTHVVSKLFLKFINKSTDKVYGLAPSKSSHKNLALALGKAEPTTSDPIKDFLEAPIESFKGVEVLLLDEAGLLPLDKTLRVYERAKELYEKYGIKMVVMGDPTQYSPIQIPSFVGQGNPYKKIYTTPLTITYRTDDIDIIRTQKAFRAKSTKINSLETAYTSDLKYGSIGVSNREELYQILIKNKPNGRQQMVIVNNEAEVARVKQELGLKGINDVVVLPILEAQSHTIDEVYVLLDHNTAGPLSNNNTTGYSTFNKAMYVATSRAKSLLVIASNDIKFSNNPKTLLPTEVKKPLDAQKKVEFIAQLQDELDKITNSDLGKSMATSTTVAPPSAPNQPNPTATTPKPPAPGSPSPSTSYPDEDDGIDSGAEYGYDGEEIVDNGEDLNFEANEKETLIDKFFQAIGIQHKLKYPQYSSIKGNTKLQRGTEVRYVRYKDRSGKIGVAAIGLGVDSKWQLLGIIGKDDKLEIGEYRVPQVILDKIGDPNFQYEAITDSELFDGEGNLNQQFNDPYTLESSTLAVGELDKKEPKFFSWGVLRSLTDFFNTDSGMSEMQEILSDYIQRSLNINPAAQDLDNFEISIFNRKDLINPALNLNPSVIRPGVPYLVVTINHKIKNEKLYIPLTGRKINKDKDASFLAPIKELLTLVKEVEIELEKLDGESKIKFGGLEPIEAFTYESGGKTYNNTQGELFLKLLRPHTKEYAQIMSMLQSKGVNTNNVAAKTKAIRSLLISSLDLTPYGYSPTIPTVNADGMDVDYMNNFFITGTKESRKAIAGPISIGNKFYTPLDNEPGFFLIEKGDGTRAYRKVYNYKGIMVKIDVPLTEDNKLGSPSYQLHDENKVKQIGGRAYKNINSGGTLIHKGNLYVGSNFAKVVEELIDEGLIPDRKKPAPAEHAFDTLARANSHIKVNNEKFWLRQTRTRIDEKGNSTNREFFTGLNLTYAPGFDVLDNPSKRSSILTYNHRYKLSKEGARSEKVAPAPITSDLLELMVGDNAFDSNGDSTVNGNFGLILPINIGEVSRKKGEDLGDYRARIKTEVSEHLRINWGEEKDGKLVGVTPTEISVSNVRDYTPAASSGPASPSTPTTMYDGTVYGDTPTLLPEDPDADLDWRKTENQKPKRWVSQKEVIKIASKIFGKEWANNPANLRMLEQAQMIRELGKDVWGNFSKGVIRLQTLGGKVSIDVFMHEAMHRVMRTFYTPEQAKYFYDLAYKLSNIPKSNITLLDEWLAEQYVKYNRDSSSVSKALWNLFRKIKVFFKFNLTKQEELENFFYQIEKGYFSYKPNNKVEFSDVNLDRLKILEWFGDPRANYEDAHDNFKTAVYFILKSLNNKINPRYTRFNDFKFGAKVDIKVTDKVKYYNDVPYSPKEAIHRVYADLLQYKKESGQPMVWLDVLLANNGKIFKELYSFLVQYDEVNWSRVDEVTGNFGDDPSLKDDIEESFRVNYQTKLLGNVKNLLSTVFISKIDYDSKTIGVDENESHIPFRTVFAILRNILAGVRNLDDEGFDIIRNNVKEHVNEDKSAGDPKVKAIFNLLNNLRVRSKAERFTVETDQGDKVWFLPDNVEFNDLGFKMGDYSFSFIQALNDKRRESGNEKASLLIDGFIARTVNYLLVNDVPFNISTVHKGKTEVIKATQIGEQGLANMLTTILIKNEAKELLVGIQVGVGSLIERNPYVGVIKQKTEPLFGEEEEEVDFSINYGSNRIVGTSTIIKIDLLDAITNITTSTNSNLRLNDLYNIIHKAQETAKDSDKKLLLERAFKELGLDYPIGKLSSNAVKTIIYNLQGIIDKAISVNTSENKENIRERISEDSAGYIREIQKVLAIYQGYPENSRYLDGKNRPQYKFVMGSFLYRIFDTIFGDYKSNKRRPEFLKGDTIGFENYYKFNPFVRNDKGLDLLEEFIEHDAIKVNKNYGDPLSIAYKHEGLEGWVIRNIILQFSKSIVASKKNPKYIQAFYTPSNKTKNNGVKIPVSSKTVLIDYIKLALQQQINRYSWYENLAKSGVFLEDIPLRQNDKGELVWVGNLNGGFSPIINKVRPGDKISNKELEEYANQTLEYINTKADKFVEFVINNKLLKLRSGGISQEELLREGDSSTVLEILNKSLGLLSKEEIEKAVTLEDKHKLIIKQAYIQNFVNGHFINQIAMGDKSLYSSPTTQIKRGSGPISPGNNGQVNTSGKKDDIGMRKEFNIIVAEDDSAVFNIWTDVSKAYSNLYGLNIDKTDAQMYYLPEWRKELVKGFSQYFKVSEVLKPVLYFIDKFGVTRYSKNSGIELTDALCSKFPELKALRDDMRAHDVMELHHKSAFKVGAPARLLKRGESIEQHLKTSLNGNAIITVPSSSYSIQLNPIAQEGEITNFSQLNYFYNINKLNKEAADLIYKVDAEIMNRNFDKWVKKIGKYLGDGKIEPNEQKIRELLAKSVGDLPGYERFEELITAKENGEYLIPLDFPSLRGRVLISLVSSASNNSIKSVVGVGNKFVLQADKGVEVFRDGDTVRLYNDLTVEEKKELNSYYSLPYHLKEALKVRANYLAINNSIENWDANKESIIEYHDLSQEEKSFVDTYVSSLVPTRLNLVTDNTTMSGRVAEVIAPAWWLAYMKKQGKEINVGDVIIPDDFLTRMGYGVRIPSTGIHSALPLKIVGTASTSLNTNIVIAPHELVALHGSDFDVDSLFIIRTVVLEDGKKKLEEIKDLDGNIIISKGQRLGYPNKVFNSFEELMESQGATEDVIATREFDSTLSKLEALLSQTTLALEKDPSNKELKQQLKLIEKAIIGTYQNKKSFLTNWILLRKVNREDMTQPITFETVKEDLFTAKAKVNTGINSVKIFKDGKLNPEFLKLLTPENANIFREIKLFTEFGLTPESSSDLIKLEDNKLIIDPKIKTNILNNEDISVKMRLKVIAGLVDFEAQRDLNDMYHNLLYYTENFSGVSLTGIFANFVKALAYVYYSTDAEPLFVDRGGKILSLTIDGVEYNKIAVRENRNRGKKIWEILDTLINSAIDNVKEQVLQIINANNRNGNVIATLVAYGIPLYKVALIMRQPVIMNELRNISAATEKSLNTGVRALKAQLQDIIKTKEGGEYKVTNSLTTNQLQKVLEEVGVLDIVNIKDLTPAQAKIQLEVLSLYEKVFPVAYALGDAARTLNVVKDVPVTFDELESLESGIESLKEYSGVKDAKPIQNTPNIEASVNIFDKILKLTRDVIRNKSTKFNNTLRGFIKELTPVRDESISDNTIMEMYNSLDKYILAGANNNDVIDQKWKETVEIPYEGFDQKEKKMVTKVTVLSENDAWIYNFGEMLNKLKKNPAYKDNQFLKYLKASPGERNTYSSAGKVFIDWLAGDITTDPSKAAEIQIDFLSLPTIIDENGIEYDVKEQIGKFAAIVYGYEFSFKNFSQLIPPTSVSKIAKLYDSIMKSLMSVETFNKIKEHFLLSYLSTGSNYLNIKTWGSLRNNSGRRIKPFIRKAKDAIVKGEKPYEKNPEFEANLGGLDPKRVSFIVDYNSVLVEKKNKKGEVTQELKEMNMPPLLIRDSFSSKKGVGSYSIYYRIHVNENTKKAYYIKILDNNTHKYKHHSGINLSLLNTGYEIKNHFTTERVLTLSPTDYAKNEVELKDITFHDYDLPTVGSTIKVRRISDHFNLTLQNYTVKAIEVKKNLEDSITGINEPDNNPKEAFNIYKANLVLVKGDVVDVKPKEQRLNIKPGVSELFESNPELSKIGTVEQYTSYLDTIFPDSKVAEIDNSLYISVLNQLEQENKIEKDCTSKGKLKAEKGLQTNFTKGGKWKLIKDLKGYPTHKEGGIDLVIGKNGVSIKNGNTQFTAKHGLVIPKN